jgi:protein-tyrosine-phosphatase
MDEKNSKKIKILFICSGNTCRSPMAQAIFSKLVFDRFGADASRFEIQSAGLNPFGEIPTREAILAMRNYGVDISNYKPTPVDHSLIEHVDMILSMTFDQKQNLQDLFPEMRDKIEVLGDIVYKEVVSAAGNLNEKEKKSKEIQYAMKEINDPYGKSIEEYELVAMQLEQILIKLLDKIEDESF